MCERMGQDLHNMPKSCIFDGNVIGRNSAIEQMINKIRSYRFIQQEDSEDGNDSIWLATIPQHLMLAQALKDRDMKIAIQAIDEINEYGFEIAKKRVSN